MTNPLTRITINRVNTDLAKHGAEITADGKFAYLGETYGMAIRCQNKDISLNDLSHQNDILNLCLKIIAFAKDNRQESFTHAVITKTDVSVDGTTKRLSHELQGEIGEIANKVDEAFTRIFPQTPNKPNQKPGGTGKESDSDDDLGGFDPTDLKAKLADLKTGSSGINPAASNGGTPRPNPSPSPILPNLPPSNSRSTPSTPPNRRSSAGGKTDNPAISPKSDQKTSITITSLPPRSSFQTPQKNLTSPLARCEISPQTRTHRKKLEEALNEKRSKPFSFTELQNLRTTFNEGLTDQAIDLLKDAYEKAAIQALEDRYSELQAFQTECAYYIDSLATKLHIKDPSFQIPTSKYSDEDKEALSQEIKDLTLNDGEFESLEKGLKKILAKMLDRTKYAAAPQNIKTLLSLAETPKAEDLSGLKPQLAKASVEEFINPLDASHLIPRADFENLIKSKETSNEALSTIIDALITEITQQTVDEQQQTSCIHSVLLATVLTKLRDLGANNPIYTSKIDKVKELMPKLHFKMKAFFSAVFQDLVG